MKKGGFIPYIVIGVLVSFMLFIGQFIYRSLQLKDNMVSKDYYEQATKFQSRINQSNNSASLNQKLDVSQTEHQVVLSFPDQLNDITGKVNFIRPSDPELDFNLAIRTSLNKMALDKSSIQKGLWQVEILCNQSGKNYYFKENIEIL